VAKWAAMYVVLNEEDYIDYSIRALPQSVDEVVVLRTMHPWNGPDVPLDATSQRVRGLNDPRVTLIEGAWGSEAEHRTAAMSVIRDLGCDYAVVVDGDEVWETDKLVEMQAAIEVSDPSLNVWRAPWWTYWKSPLWRVDPPEPSSPVVAVRMTDEVQFTDLRDPHVRAETFSPAAPVLHHFSYAKPNHQIWEKVHAFGHASEIRSNWWEDVWMGWEQNHELEDLNPVYPDNYKRAVYSGVRHLPERMRKHPFVVNGLNGLLPIDE